MALNKYEKTQKNLLSTFAQKLANMGLSKEEITDSLKEQLDDFATESKVKLTVKVQKKEDGTSVVELAEIDLSADFIRTRHNTGKTMQSLRVKVLGLPIEIKVKKDEAVFSNEQVVSSLRMLADYVEAMPVEAKDAGSADFPLEKGGAPIVKGDNDTDSDNDGDGDVDNDTDNEETGSFMPASTEQVTNDVSLVEQTAAVNAPIQQAQDLSDLERQVADRQGKSASDTALENAKQMYQGVNELPDQ